MIAHCQHSFGGFIAKVWQICALGGFERLEHGEDDIPLKAGLIIWNGAWDREDHREYLAPAHNPIHAVAYRVTGVRSGSICLARPTRCWFGISAIIG
jgi:hypothetical protein